MGNEIAYTRLPTNQSRLLLEWNPTTLTLGSGGWGIMEGGLRTDRQSERMIYHTSTCLLH